MFMSQAFGCLRSIPQRAIAGRRGHGRSVRVVAALPGSAARWEMLDVLRVALPPLARSSVPGTG